LRSGRPTTLAAILLASSVEAAEPPRPCFDFDTTVVEPLRPPIAILPGRDNSVFGTDPGGVDWASTRAHMAMPISDLYARLLDHRNHKDMKKTVLETTEIERPGYLRFQRVDIAVTVRKLLFKATLRWTEEWGFSLVEGTPEAPLRIVASYQKTSGGTKHLKHQCGSYVLQAIDEGSSDLSMYDEIVADRRDAEDTRDMQAGILRNIRRQQP
jgi:hypothetical protein